MHHTVRHVQNNSSRIRIKVTFRRQLNTRDRLTYRQGGLSKHQRQICRIVIIVFVVISAVKLRNNYNNPGNLYYLRYYKNRNSNQIKLLK